MRKSTQPLQAAQVQKRFRLSGRNNQPRPAFVGPDFPRQARILVDLYQASFRTSHDPVRQGARGDIMQSIAQGAPAAYRV
jgi:hypothetical protein